MGQVVTYSSMKDHGEGEKKRQDHTVPCGRVAVSGYLVVIFPTSLLFARSPPHGWWPDAHTHISPCSLSFKSGIIIKYVGYVCRPVPSLLHVHTLLMSVV